MGRVQSGPDDAGSPAAISSLDRSSSRDVVGPDQTIGHRIRASRKKAGLNQGELAALLGVTQPTVANWEAGAHDPRQLMIAKLAEALRVSLGWLAGGEQTAADRNEGPATPYVRRPIQHVPVLSPDGAVRVTLEGLDPHDLATDYVPVTYGEGHLAAVFLTDAAAPERAAPAKAGALFILDYERTRPVPGETVLLCTEAGPIIRDWPEGGRAERIGATVIASIRFH